MDPLKVGIIGYGGFGKFLHHSWSALQQVEIIAVADREVAKVGSSKGVQFFDRWEDLLRTEVDIVAIATPPDQHSQMAITAMQSGKHLLIEKPLAIDLETAQQIIETRDATNRIAAIDFMFRFHPLLLQIRRFCRDNIFGPLRRVVIENYAQDASLPLEHWFWDPAQSGGILVEHGVHFIDLVHFLQPAKVIRIDGHRHQRNDRQEDQLMANVLYEGGLMTTHYHSFARPGFFETTKIKLTFDLADLELEGWIPLHATVRALVNPETKTVLTDLPSFELQETKPLNRITDESRPKGWGVNDSNHRASTTTIRSRGIPYTVNEMITGQLHTHQSKATLYAAAVCNSLLDLVKKIQDSQHTLAAPLEAGLTSLSIALQATASARRPVNISNQSIQTPTVP